MNQNQDFEGTEGWIFLRYEYINKTIGFSVKGILPCKAVLRLCACFINHETYKYHLKNNNTIKPCMPAAQVKNRA